MCVPVDVIHTYIHTYMHTYVHTYILAHMYKHIYVYLYIYVHLQKHDVCTRATLPNQEELRLTRCLPPARCSLDDPSELAAAADDTDSEEAARGIRPKVPPQEPCRRYEFGPDKLLRGDLKHGPVLRSGFVMVL